LRARPEPPAELNWHLAAVAAYLESFEALIIPIRKLLRELTGESSSATKAG
jgi:hypothetical protein